MPAFSSFVALGDSFSEGVGDPDPLCRNGLRGWTDLVAAELNRTTPGFRYANFAVRGRLLDQVIAEQVPPAVALAPSLVTVYAGGNDLLRHKPEIDGLVSRYAVALRALRDTGAHVAVFTAYNAGWAPVFKYGRGRCAIYNELVREVADDLGLTVVDFWRFRGYDDPRMWAVDRLHMSSLGHQRMAAEVLDALGVAHDLTAPSLEPLPTVGSGRRRRENLLWAKEYAAPWIERRLRGTSSGDGVSPQVHHPRTPRPRRPPRPPVDTDLALLRRSFGADREGRLSVGEDLRRGVAWRPSLPACARAVRPRGPV